MSYTAFYPPESKSQTSQDIIWHLSWQSYKILLCHNSSIWQDCPINCKAPGSCTRPPGGGQLQQKAAPLLTPNNCILYPAIQRKHAVDDRNTTPGRSPPNTLNGRNITNPARETFPQQRQEAYIAGRTENILRQTPLPKQWPQHNKGCQSDDRKHPSFRVKHSSHKA